MQQPMPAAQFQQRRGDISLPIGFQDAYDAFFTTRSVDRVAALSAVKAADNTQSNSITSTPQMTCRHGDGRAISILEKHARDDIPEKCQ